MDDKNNIKKIQKSDLIDDVYTEFKNVNDEKFEYLKNKVDKFIARHFDEDCRKRKPSVKQINLENKMNDFKMTPKEKEIIPFIIDGFTNKEIARIKNNSINTINYQIHNIYKKAGVNNKEMLINIMKAK